MWQKIFEKAIQTAAIALVTEGKKILPKIPDALSKLKDWWNGKSIAVIGATATGKNSLFNRLKNEYIPEQHIQTRGSETVKNFDFSWTFLGDNSEIKFKCKKSVNVGGEIDERERYWLDSCQNADVIFYLIDFEKLRNNKDKTLKRIKSDFKWLVSHSSEFKSGSKIHLLVNKVDLIFSNNEESDEENIQQTVISNVTEYINEIQSSVEKIFGSNSKQVSGISPISMTDQYLFRIYFDLALKEIFKSEEV